MGRRGPRALNSVSATLLLASVVLGFAVFKFSPVLLTEYKLEGLVNEYAFQIKGRVTDQELIDAFREDARQKFGAIIDEKDVHVHRGIDRAKFTATWRPIVELPLGYVVELKFDMGREVLQF